MTNNYTKWLGKIPQIASVLMLIVGVFVCLEWIIGFNFIAGLFAGYARMKFNTAILSLLSGVSLLALEKNQSNKAHSISIVFPCITMIFASWAIIQTFVLFDTGLDSLTSVASGLSTADHTYLRTSPISAFVFLLMNAAVVLLHSTDEHNRFIAKVLGIIGGTIVYNIVIGYFLGINLLIFDNYEYNTMSYPASVLLVLFSFSLLSFRDEHITNLIKSNFISGMLARRIIPLVALVPIFTLWLTLYGKNEGLFSEHISDSIAITLNTATFLGILIFITNSIYRLEQRKDSTDRKISQSEELFRKTFDFSPVGKVMLTTDLKFLKCNKAFCNFIGYSEDELLRSSFARISYPQDSHVGKEIIDQVLSKQIESGGFRKRYQHKDGNSVWGDISIGLIHGASPDESFLLLVVQDISERINFENKLRTERDRAMQYFNTSTVMLVVLDTEGNIVRINRRGYEILGYQVGSLTGKNWFDTCLPADTIEDTKSVFFKILLEPNLEFEKHENSIVCFDGTEKTIRWYNSVLYDDRENPTGMLSSGEDISEQLIIEDQLRETEVIFNAFLEHCPVYFFFKDSEIRSLRLSRNFEQMLGMPLDQAIGKTMDELFPSDLAKSMIEDDKRIIRERAMIRVEEEFAGRFFETMKFPIEIEGKPPMLAGFTVDITERKISGEMLKQEKLYFEQLVESLPGIFYLFTYPELRLKRWNKNFLTLTGYSEDEMLGKSIFDFHPKDSYNYIENAWEQVIKQDSHMIEAPLVDRNGKQTPYLLTGISVVIDGNRHMMGVGIDITERKQFLEQTIQAKEKAEENDKLKSSFLQNMSHEIRTPLNGILGFVSILKDKEYNSEDEMNECLDIVSSSSHRLLGIVNDVLEISRLDSRTLQVRKEDFTVGEVFLYFNAMYSSTASEKGLEFVLNLPDKLSTLVLYTDKDKFYQIITNLLNNAFKFTHEGSVELGFDKQGSGFNFFVKDSGIGIKPEFLEKVFERFWQYEAFSNMKYGGTGLGLSISLGIAELLGMRFEVASELGHGTCFKLIINSNAIKFASDQPRAKSKSDTFLPKLASSVRVLIAEDEDANYKYLEKLLEGKQFKVSRAVNGLEAIEKTESEIFDIILIDVKMPEMDGLTATKEIRKRNPKLPIIAQTAYSGQEEYSNAIQAGCNGFISKPIDKKRLMDTISKYLQ